MIHTKRIAQYLGIFSELVLEHYPEATVNIRKLDENNFQLAFVYRPEKWGRDSDPFFGSMDVPYWTMIAHGELDAFHRTYKLFGTLAPHLEKRERTLRETGTT